MDRERIENDIAQLATRLDARTSSPNVEDVDKGLDLLDEVDTYLTRSVFGNNLNSDYEPNVVVLGTTGAGKSTVVSFLFGEGKLVVHHESRYSHVLTAEPPLPGVSIRSGATSSTLLPVMNHVKLKDAAVAVWDMPGSRDTRGPFVELVVHFIYRWMLKDDKALNFIIVTPPLHERPQIVMLERMINGSLIREDNAVVVYTKCGIDFDPESIAELKIDKSKREIRSFALPAPVKDDMEGQDYSVQFGSRKHAILRALSDLRSYKVSYDKTLPDAAKLLLDSITKTCVEFVQEKLSAIFLRVYKWSSYRAAYGEMNTTLEVLQRLDAMSLEEMMSILSRIVPLDNDLVRYDPQFRRASHRLSIMETLNGGETQRPITDWLNTKCIHELEKFKVKLLELRNAVKAYGQTSKLSGIPNILVISAFEFCLSNEQARIRKFMQKREKTIDSAKTIPNVILVGFSSLEVDVNFRMWANVALISPSIEVTAPRGFDLSAKSQADCAEKRNDVRGQDGIHGTPGLPGGNLIVACQQLKDDHHTLRSTISCGQCGGVAQNGGGGRNGKDSAYSEAMFKVAIDGEIKLGLLLEDNTSVPRALKNGLQLTEYKRDVSPLSGVVCGTPGKTYLTIEKESELGTSRTPPGSGGQGGTGGRGGHIRIMQRTRNVWEGVGSLGQKGQDGSPGEASREGYTSSAFTATIQQWYCKGGWFHDNFAEPEIIVEEEKVKQEDQPQLVHAQPAKESGGHAVINLGLDLVFVKGMYQVLRASLGDKFPQCGFSDLNVGWESEDTPATDIRLAEDEAL